jgi:phosphoribosylcarboxyaminoimidazole (NCAIR) mutase
MKKKVLVSIVMGSQSDWKTLVDSENILNNFQVACEKKLSLHTEPRKDFMNMQKVSKKEKLKL